MHITFKIILDTRRAKRNSLYPLILRIYQSRLCRSHPLGIDLSKDHWNEQDQIVKRSSPNCKFYNLQINSLKAKVMKVLLMYEEEEDL